MASKWLSLLRALREDFMGDVGVELQKAQRETNLSRAIVLVWVSVSLMPTTCLPFIWALAPNEFPAGFRLVLGAVLAVLAIRFGIKTKFFDEHHQLAIFLMSGLVHAPLATGIMELTRASGANFFFPFFMIYFAFTLFYVLDVKWFLATSAAIIGSYFTGIILRPGPFTLGDEEIQNLIYLANLSGIAVVGNRMLAKLFFDEKRSRMELAVANEGLRELDHAKTSFFHNISHEIRTPLTLILTPIEHLLQQENSKLSPQVEEKLRGVRINGLRLLKMVNALLDFAKVESGRERVNLNEFRIDDLIEYTASLFGATALERKIDLVVNTNSGKGTIWSDVDKMEKVLVNLLSNAMKFTPAGGTITISSAHKGDEFEIRVSDTGSGIAKENHGKIFERFAQVEDQQTLAKGTGIGLAMVRDYCRLLGGDVRVESELGKGATFVVRHPERGPQSGTREVTNVPKARPDSDSGAFIAKSLADSGEMAAADILDAQTQTDVLSVPHADATRPWIMVVDDNPSLLSLLRSILETEYNLYLAPDGMLALAHLANHRVDLILSDVMMPGISGLELCKRVKTHEDYRHIPVILLTARGGTASKVEGFEHGADDYIGKPFDPAELKARVRALFQLRKLTAELAQQSRDLKEAMEKLVQEELKLIESEKLRTLGEIAAGMAHELHNCLNMILNGTAPIKDGLEAVRSQLDDADDLIELTQVVADAAKTAVSVTGELKRYAYHGKTTVSAEMVDLHNLLRSTVRLFGLSGPKLNITFDLTDQPITVECPANRLTQVFTNLIKNGIEAAGPNGGVTIRTRIEDTNAVVHVEDTGPGVDESQREQLFRAFHTTKAPGAGLGLGLALSKKVVEELGGELAYDPSYSDGARFVVKIPSPHHSMHAN